MAIGTSMRSLVVGNGTIAGYVSTRVYPLVFPAQATMPCITYRIISGAMVPHTGSEDVYITRIQYDIWSESYNTTNAVKDALFDQFNQYSGTVSGQVIMDTLVDLNFDTFEKDTKLYRSVVDIRVRHSGA